MLKYYFTLFSLSFFSLYSINTEEELFQSLLYQAKEQEASNAPYDTVYESYRKAAQCNPLRAEPLFHLSEYFIKHNQIVLAYHLSKQATSLPPSSPSSFINEYGCSYLLACTALALQKYEEAIPLFEDLILHKNLPEKIKGAAETSLLRCLKQTSPLKKTIGIFTALIEGSSPWDPDSIHSGISGSEEAIIYMSQQLADLGYQVLIFGDPPKHSPHSKPLSNPRYVPLNAPLQDPFDIAIAWRLPIKAPELKKRGVKLYFWPHDTWTTALSKEQITSFDEVLWLSEWQRKQWISKNPGFSKFTKIFGNGILPKQFNSVTERKNPYSCIYASNYGRGLQHLLDLWPSIKAEFPQATLDIYYGWTHFGLLSPQQELSMKEQIKKLAPLSVYEHGKVGHQALAKAFEEASFWTYPCNAPETFCITALKAQLAGALPVIIKQTALAETCRYGFSCTQKEEYLKTLLQAMQSAESISLEDRVKMRSFILEDFSWEKLALKWDALFQASP